MRTRSAQLVLEAVGRTREQLSDMPSDFQYGRAERGCKRPCYLVLCRPRQGARGGAGPVHDHGRRALRSRVMGAMSCVRSD